jgi:hypothetical protein
LRTCNIIRRPDLIRHERHRGRGEIILEVIGRLVPGIGTMWGRRSGATPNMPVPGMPKEENVPPL